MKAIELLIKKKNIIDIFLPYLSTVNNNFHRHTQKNLQIAIIIIDYDELKLKSYCMRNK